MVKKVSVICGCNFARENLSKKNITKKDINKVTNHILEMNCGWCAEDLGYLL